MNAIAKTVKVFQKKRCKNCDFYFSKDTMIASLAEGDDYLCSLSRYYDCKDVCDKWEWDGSWCGFRQIFKFILNWAIIWVVIHEISN